MAEKTTQVNDGLGLPYSLEAEQSVLGAVLVDPNKINEIADVLKPEYFYLPEHQSVFSYHESFCTFRYDNVESLLA